MNDNELKELTRVVPLLVILALGLFAGFCALLRRLRTLVNNPERLPWRRLPAQNLSQWLETATRKLAPPARARIQTEIEAHYAEAVQLHLASGLPETAAHAAALADLGNAYAAARRFGREHLTEKDVAQIAWLMKFPKPAKEPGKRMLYASVIFAVAAAVPFLFQVFDVGQLLKFETIALLLFVMGKMNRSIGQLAALAPTPANLRQMLLYKSMVWLGCAAVNYLLLYDQIAPKHLEWNGSIGVFLFYADIMVAVCLLLAPFLIATPALSLLRLRRKLNCSNTEGPDLPPQNPTAA